MIVHIRKNAPKDKVKKTLKTITPKKSKMDLDAYFGKVNYGVDGLTYQKQMRENE